MRTLINLDYLKAAAAYASTEETRFYLKGVYVSVHPDADTVTYVATNGHVLFAACDHLDSTDDVEGDGAWIVPLDFIKGLKLPRNSALRYAAFEGATGGLASPVTGRRVNVSGAVEGAFTPVDGEFPEWQNVVPKELREAGKAAQFDGRYLALLEQTAKALGTPHPVIHFNGDNPTPVTFGSETHAFAVIMPRRAREEEWRGLGVLTDTKAEGDAA